MNWAVVVEGCELVGSCEDVHGGGFFLGYIRDMWQRKREKKSVPWVRRRIYPHRKLTTGRHGVGGYSEHQRQVPRVGDADWYYKWTWN